ncbi:MAG: class I SAM-dependent methyltransferase [Pyrinomonadaceae bacterium]
MKIFKIVPALRRIWNERKLLWQPPGHFYSPIPSNEDISAHQASFIIPKNIPGIDLNEPEQWRYYDFIKSFYAEMPFPETKTDGIRYSFDGPNYGYSDAICYYGMIRHLKPRRIVEIGSGYSSCVALDTNELFLSGSMELTCIEPYPELLLSIIKEEDQTAMSIIPSKLQDVNLETFSALAAGDILFVDSTHISKLASDVNRILFEILPALNSGVFIHFHDIHYPFEYIPEWVEQNRAWNEAYLLRAFLQYNEAFEIVFFNTYLEHSYPERFIKDMPLCMKNVGGSIWLRKK